MQLLSDVDWESAEMFLTEARRTNPAEVLIPFQVGNFWMVVSPEFREEISGTFGSREDAEEVIAVIEVGRKMNGINSLAWVEMNQKKGLTV